MKNGYLSEYFEGVAAKCLSAVEADETRSNQHEYNATRKMLTFIGRPTERMRIPARFLYLTDDDPEPIVEAILRAVRPAPAKAAAALAGPQKAG